jgi:hypothetical protein
MTGAVSTSNGYIDRIVGPAKEYGFPDWYTSTTTESPLSRISPAFFSPTGGRSAIRPKIC